MAGLVVLVGCGGDDEETTDEGCLQATVAIAVADQEGNPVEGATVELDDLPCTDDGGGAYSCVAPPGTYVAAVLKTPDFNPYAETIVIEEGACDLSLDVVLPPPLVY
jgi:protocatechuate 3,4-dioxygenase beta subunit